MLAAGVGGERGVFRWARVSCGVLVSRVMAGPLGVGNGGGCGWTLEAAGHVRVGGGEHKMHLWTTTH